MANFDFALVLLFLKAGTRRTETRKINKPGRLFFIGVTFGKAFFISYSLVFAGMA